MKAIIFYCIDNFNEEYRVVKVCKADLVDQVVREHLSRSTEVEDYEIVEAHMVTK